MKDYTSSEPAFWESIKIVETTDAAHADNINMAPEQLLQNTLFLYGAMEMLCDTSTIESVFYEVFTNAQDKTAMTSSDVETALATEWSGESSKDETAMSSEDVEDATSTEWNGESSTDETAMSAEDVDAATTT